MPSALQVKLGNSLMVLDSQSWQLSLLKAQSLFQDPSLGALAELALTEKLCAATICFFNVKLFGL